MKQENLPLLPTSTICTGIESQAGPEIVACVPAGEDGRQLSMLDVFYPAGGADPVGRVLDYGWLF